MSGIFMLTGCASLSEHECRTGDWGDIGFRDGMAGYPASRLGDHVEACREFRVEPERQAYFDGRERGLRVYCTPASGLSAGRRGASYAGVCPVASEDRFLRAWEAGHAVYEAQARLDSLERERSALEDRIFHARNDDERHRLHAQLDSLRSRMMFARAELGEREAWASLHWR